ncbi:ABATE domain-containing protein [Streptomyces sp. MUM 203J]|uniref:CGNR zinc finger domain-containing protein n=1 Tax=Streptomyces sp. MUM 203J TaxID=2791990 RepID=UPI001F03363D|nr:ABATE domain-containing protein [Streptomyces sp. MUM 203J]MCH0541215.1 ABATE domain-containing protein [Streptomyces sp. MUM 203J]
MGDSTKPGQDGREAVGQLPLAGEPLPLDLVNTTYIKGGRRGHLVDALTVPEALDAWLAAHRAEFSPALTEALEDSGPAGPAHVEAFTELRGALRDLAAARTSGTAPEPGPVDVVNTAARLATRWRELAPGAAFAAVPRWLEADPRRVALGEVAAAAVSLFSGDRAALIRACGAPGCILYFVKSHARRAWCTAGCGNRVRVARHSRRAKDGGGTGPDTEGGSAPGPVPPSGARPRG